MLLGLNRKEAKETKDTEAGTNAAGKALRWVSVEVMSIYGPGGYIVYDAVRLAHQTISILFRWVRWCVPQAHSMSCPPRSRDGGSLIAWSICIHLP